MNPTLGVHLCWGTYGFWLPNDPRGSGSGYVWSDELYELGPATGLADRSRSVARRPHDRRALLEAKKALSGRRWCSTASRRGPSAAGSGDTPGSMGW